MACLPCQRQRKALIQSARSLNFPGVATALKTGATIAADKLRGVDVNAKYGTVTQATPYRRTVK